MVCFDVEFSSASGSARFRLSGFGLGMLFSNLDLDLVL